MRVGVNALYLIPGGVGGTEIYLRHLLRGLSEVDGQTEFLVFTNRETDSSVAPDAPNVRVVPQAVKATVRPARIAWEQTLLPLCAARNGVDVLLNPGFTAPLVAPCPSVTVFHDLQHKRHPEHFRWFDLPFWRVLLYAAAQRSERLIAVSEATRADLLRYYRLPDARIAVVTHGVDAEFFRLRRSPGNPPYFLCVSTLHPHKNLDRLLRAFATFRNAHQDFRLVCAGMRGFFTEELESLRGHLGLREAVEFTGWISRERLLDLYAGAHAFVYPSTFEGFGLPVLEALAAGLPTACSAIEPLASIAGPAAIPFHPSDTNALADALRRLASDGALCAQLSAAGPSRAAAFTWEKSARLTLEVLGSAAARV